MSIIHAESTVDPTEVGELELTKLWQTHVETETLLLDAIKARRDGSPLIEQVQLLDRAAVVMSDNKAALQHYRNSIIVPD